MLNENPLWLRACIALSIGCLCILPGCAEDVECDSILEQAVTYTTDIEPLFEAKCNYCHNHEKTGAEREGAPAGVDYTTYASVVENALGALDEIRAEEMPPICEDCPSVPNTEETNLLCNWIEQGMPE